MDNLKITFPFESYNSPFETLIFNAFSKRKKNLKLEKITFPFESYNFPFTSILDPCPKIEAHKGRTDGQDIMGESASSITPRSQIKGTCWSITLNNPSQEEISLWNNITKAAHFVRSAQGQLERGEKTGTLHIQGLLRTDSQRQSAVEKLFPRAHVEKAKNASALQKYVSKPETRVAPLQSSKREVEVATPESIQNKLYSNYSSVICKYKAEPLWTGTYKNNLSWKLVERATPFENNPFNFLKLITEEQNWKSYFRDKAKYIMDDIFDQMIQEGYYGVEFISSNNLTCGAFKKHLYSIIIRHARKESNASEASAASEASHAIPEEIDE